MTVRFLVGISLAMFVFGLAIAQAADSPKPDPKDVKAAILTAERDAIWEQLKDERAQAALAKAIADAGKALGCEIDPATAECKPKPEIAKPASQP